MPGQFVIATLFEVGDGRTATTEKAYWSRATADSHWMKTRNKDRVIALVMYDPEWNVIRSYNRGREE